MSPLRPVSLDPATIDARISESLLLGELEPEARALVRDAVQPLMCPGGEFLIHQDDSADAIYLVTSGRLHVLSIGPDGTETPIAEIGRGEVVGEMALISREPRTASVQALRDTQLLKLPAETFTRLVRDYPEALRRVGGTIVTRLIRTFRTVTKNSPVQTIAVVALDDGSPRTFARQLSKALVGIVGDVAHLDVDSHARMHGSVGVRDPDLLAQFMSREEDEHDLLVYDTNADDPGWAELCVRQADLVLFVADGAASPMPRPIEQPLAAVRGNRRTEFVLMHDAHVSMPRWTSRWFSERTVARHHHVRAGHDADIARVARLITGRGIAVVLGGGGARGFAHLGVLRALEEFGVPIDAIGGTSMGSLIASGVALGLDAPARVSALREAIIEGPSALDFTFPAVALASGARVTGNLQRFFGDTNIDDLWVDYFAVSCNLTQGEVVVDRTGPVWQAVRSSLSIPGIFPPLRRGNDLLVDGGVLDNLPVQEMQRLHEGAYVIAVDVSNKRDLVAGDLPEAGIVSGWRALVERFNPLRPRRESIGIARILMRLTELSSAFGFEADLADLVLRPPIQAFGAMDFRRSLDGLEDLGYRYAKTEIAEWLTSHEAPPVLCSNATSM
jgi:predicted acylesterase/phospholipase RssA/CRP-like cAMP-binding protein